MKKKGFSPTKLLVTIIMALMVFTMMFPLLWMLSTSFKVEGEVFAFPMQWITPNFNLDNYITVLTGNYHFPLYFLNSVKVTLAVVVLQIIVCSMAAYAFAKMKFRFREGLFSLFLATMMIPDQVTLVPRFLVVNGLNLYDSHFGLTLLMTFGSVYGVFLLRQSMIAIPDSIIESTRIDGAGHWRIFVRIILPMSKPALATLVIMRFVWTWNDYQNSLVFLRTKSLFTLQLGMSQFADQVGTKYAMLMAASVLAILPMFLIFCIGQKSIIEGMAAGAVKG